MSSTTLRVLFALFLIAHGWIHASLAWVPTPQPGAMRTPFFPAWWRDAIDPNWPIIKMGVNPPLARAIGWMLWVLLTICFVIASGVLLFAPGLVSLWQGFTAAGAVLSLALLILFWHPWLVLGVVIDLALLAGVFLKAPFLRFDH